MKQLVVAIDGSESSEMACRWALALASSTQAIVTVACVIDDSGSSDALPEAMHSTCTRLLTTSDVSGESRVLHGNPPEKLLELAAEVDAELIVIGRRRRSPLAPRLLGSFSRRLLRGNQIPVVSVPAPSEMGSHHALAPTAVVGLDGTAAAKTVLAVASLLSDALDLDVDAVSVVDIHDETAGRSDVEGRWDVASAERSLQELVADVRPRFRRTIATHTAVGLPSDELLRRASGAELLVVGHRRATPIGSFLNHSTSRYSAAHATCPVVMIPIEPVPTNHANDVSYG